MPDIYRMEKTGDRTGNTYRLDISAAGAALGGSPSVEVLVDGAVKEMTDWGWEDRDLIPYGMPSAVSGKIKFKPSLCPPTLVTWVLDGITSVSADIYVGATTHTVTFDTGTVFCLYIKPPGGADFTLVAQCVQDVTQDTDPDWENDEIEISVGDVLQHALKALTFSGEGSNPGIVDADWDGITNADPAYAGTKARTAVVDWVWLGGSDWFYVAHVPPGSEVDADPASCYWSVKAQTMAERWSDYVQAIVRKITRRSTNVNIDYALMKSLSNMYAQSHADDALPGNALTDAEIRWLFFATNDNDIDPTTERNFALHDVLATAYDNVWDFIYDVPRSRFKRWWITHYVDGGTDTGFRQEDPFGHPFTAEDVTSQLHNPTLKMRGEAVVARTESQTEFGIADDYTSEITKAPSSRNNKSIDLPVIFDSAPVADEYTLGSQLATGYFTDRNQEIRDRLQNKTVAMRGTTDIQGKDAKPIGNPRFLGIYYDTNPTDGGAGDAFHFDGALIRCHAWQPFVIDGEAVTPPASTPVVLSTTPGTIGGYSLAIAEQQIHGTIGQLGRKMFDAYYGKNSTRIEAEVEFNFGAVLDLTGTTSQFAPFSAVIRPFTVDPATFASYLSALPTEYYMVECKADFQTELLKITLWGK